MTTQTILCIDDEQSILKALQRVLKPTRAEILLARGGREALAVLEEKDADLVVCDMRMPGMDGYETLRAIRQAHPRATRVVLSGYATKETMLKAVLDGTASVYVQKPWSNHGLVGLVNHLLAMRRELDRDGLRELFADLDGLPALPKLYRKVMEMIGQDRQAAEIAAMIEREPAYAAKILRVANSAIHGVSIGSVRHAVVYLGLNTIKNIILTCELFSNAPGGSEGPYGVEDLWMHSNLCNLAASALHRRLHGNTIAEEFASAGLLHDIGKFLMIRYLPEACRKIEAILVDAPQTDGCEAERMVLGVSHAEIGGLLMDWWNLPAHVVEGCLFHHDPLDKRVLDREWVGLLHAADHLAWRAQDRDRGLPTDEELACAGIDAALFDDAELRESLDKNRFRLSAFATPETDRGDAP